MKFNLARCSNKMVLGSDSNFPNGFFFAVLVVPGIARGWSSGSKTDGFGSGHFHGCLYQGVQKQRLCGFPHVNHWKWVVSWSWRVGIFVWWLRILNTSMRAPETMMAELLVIYLSLIDFCILKIITKGVFWIHSKEDVQRWRLLSCIQKGAKRWCVS